MIAYNPQPSPPSGAFQQDIDSLNAARDPLLRAGGVLDSSGRGHSTFSPQQAHEIASRGGDIAFLKPQVHVQGRDL